MFEKITERSALNQLKAELQQRITAYQMETQFPKDLLGKPGDFGSLVNRCFKHTSAEQLRMKWPDYKAVREQYAGNYTMLDMGTILYVLRQRTQQELGFNKEQYIEFGDAVENLYGQWMIVMKEKETEIANELEAAYLESHPETEAETPQSTTIPLGLPAEA